MKKIIVAIPHSHSWFWTQSCIASLKCNPPLAKGHEVEIVVVDNSPWSPAIRGITDTDLWDNSGITVVPNHKTNKFHASALDCVVEDFNFDLLMALETDVLALRPEWLQWFMDQLRETDYAVGMWHHEQFINPSCTLYRSDVLQDMLQWCKNHPNPDNLRWGPGFANTAPLDNNLPLSENPEAVLTGIKNWIAGPFAEKRGWPAGVILKEEPSGQLKGPGWYEPGQQLHHWAVEAGYTYTICPTLTTKRSDNLPLQSVYGEWGFSEYKEAFDLSEFRPQVRMGCGVVRFPELVEEGYDHQRQLGARELFGSAYTAHLWGGTRALDILKHPVTCQFVKANTPGWLAREARFWLDIVPLNVQVQTLKLIRKYGWYYTGQGSDHISDRDREAEVFVKKCYKEGGVSW